MLAVDNQGITTGWLVASAQAVFKQPVSCLAPAPATSLIQNVLTYHWKQGAKSTITFTVTTVTRAGGLTIVTSTGTVTDGFNQGAPAFREIVMPDIYVQQCLEGGIEEQPGTIRLTIG